MAITIKEIKEALDKTTREAITLSVEKLRLAYEELKSVNLPVGTEESMQVDSFTIQLNVFIKDLEDFINKGGSQNG